MDDVTTEKTTNNKKYTGRDWNNKSNNISKPTNDTANGRSDPLYRILTMQKNYRIISRSDDNVLVKMKVLQEIIFNLFKRNDGNKHKDN